MSFSRQESPQFVIHRWAILWVLELISGNYEKSGRIGLLRIICLKRGSAFLGTESAYTLTLQGYSLRFDRLILDYLLFLWIQKRSSFCLLIFPLAFRFASYLTNFLFRRNFSSLCFRIRYIFHFIRFIVYNLCWFEVCHTFCWRYFFILRSLFVKKVRVGVGWHFYNISCRNGIGIFLSFCLLFFLFLQVREFRLFLFRLPRNWRHINIT